MGWFPNSEYKTLAEGQQKEISHIFLKFILTSCWPKMYCHVNSWPCLSLIMQLCTVDCDTIQFWSSQHEPLSVQPDITLLSFLQSGWDHYLPKLLDHHPDVKAHSTNSAPLPQKLLDAIISKGSYTYSTDVAINFHNLLTSSLIAYVVHLDYVDRALQKLKGRGLPDSDSGTIGPLFDGLSVAVQAVFALSHSKAMAAHMDMLSSSLRFPMDKDACDSLTFISDLIKSHCQQSEEAKGVAPYLKPHHTNSGGSNAQDGSSDSPSSCGAVADNGQHSSQEDNLDDSLVDNLDDNSDDEAWAMELTALTSDKNDSASSPRPVVFRRWIMSFIDHFTSVRVLE